MDKDGNIVALITGGNSTEDAETDADDVVEGDGSNILYDPAEKERKIEQLREKFQNGGLWDKILAIFQTMGVSLEDRYKAVHAIYVQAMASAGFDPEIASEAFDMSVGSVAMESAIGSVAKGISGIKGAGSKIINSVDDVKFNQKSVDHAFSKHKADFGNYPDGSKASVNQFTNDVKTLIENGTQKAGTYRSMPGTHIYNPTTKQWVFINSDGTFNAAFKLSDEQFKYLIETGVVK